MGDRIILRKLSNLIHGISTESSLPSTIRQFSRLILNFHFLVSLDTIYFRLRDSGKLLLITVTVFGYRINSRDKFDSTSWHSADYVILKGEFKNLKQEIVYRRQAKNGTV